MFLLALIVVLALIVGCGTYAFVVGQGHDPGAPAASPGVVRERVHRGGWLARLAYHRPDPERAAGSLLGVGAVGVAAGAIAVGVLAGMVRSHTGFVLFDMSVTRFGADHHTGLSTHVLRLITQLGGAIVLVPVAVVVGVGVGVRRRTWRPAVFLAVVVGGQFAIADVVKAIVHRTRPDVLRLTGFSGPSFPSGHATASGAVFLALALVLARGWSRTARAVATAVAAGLAAAVGATRVLLGVHWLTDVVAGWLLGWTWFTLCSLAFGGRLLRLGAPVAVAETAATGVPPAATVGQGAT